MTSDGEDEGTDERLETARLVLRRPQKADAPAIAALIGNWHVAANLARVPHPYREDDAAEWVARLGSDRGRAFVITLARGGTLIGACGIAPASWTSGLQIGYWLGEPFWGCGYATEAARAIIECAFADVDLTHLWCSCRVTNNGSRGVIQKCGFQFHSAGMMHNRAIGAMVPVEHYCLDRALWQGLNRWKAA